MPGYMWHVTSETYHVTHHLLWSFQSASLCLVVFRWQVRGETWLVPHHFLCQVFGVIGTLECLVEVRWKVRSIRWHVTGDLWYVISNIWCVKFDFWWSFWSASDLMLSSGGQVTRERWHVTRYIWRMTWDTLFVFFLVLVTSECPVVVRWQVTRCKWYLPLTCDMWHMIHDSWHMTHDLCYLGYFPHTLGDSVSPENKI